MRILTIILILLLFTGCEDKTARQRDEAIAIAIVLKGQRDQAMDQAERAVRAAEYWRNEALKCQKQPTLVSKDKR